MNSRNATRRGGENLKGNDPIHIGLPNGSDTPKLPILECDLELAFLESAALANKQCQASRSNSYQPGINDTQAAAVQSRKLLEALEQCSPPMVAREYTIDACYPRSSICEPSPMQPKN